MTPGGSEGRPTGRRWRRRDRRRQLTLWISWLAGTLATLQCWRAVSSRTTWRFAADAPAQAADLFSRMLPPSWSSLLVLGRPLWDTVNIATLGTLLALAAAVPVALAAARNTAPHPTLRPIALLAIVCSRSINSLLWALLLVTVLGPGVLAGILAIAFRSLGFVAKLLYEAIEEIDPVPVEAVAATGASRPQVLAYGRAAGAASLRRYLALSLGHQRPRGDRRWTGGGRRDWPAARCRHLDPSVEARQRDPLGHPRARVAGRVGLGSGAPGGGVRVTLSALRRSAHRS